MRLFSNTRGTALITATILWGNSIQSLARNSSTTAVRLWDDLLYKGNTVIYWTRYILSLIHIHIVTFPYVPLILAENSRIAGSQHGSVDGCQRAGNSRFRRLMLVFLYPDWLADTFIDVDDHVNALVCGSFWLGEERLDKAHSTSSISSRSVSSSHDC